MDTYGIHGNLLEVTVVACNKLKDTEWLSRQDPYVCIEYGSNRSRTLTCKDGGQNPTFEEKFVYTLIEGLRELNINVWNSNTLTTDDFIGSGKVQLEKAFSQGFDDRTWPLQSRSGRHAGEVQLIIEYSNANKPAGSHVPAASSHAAPQAFYSPIPLHPSTSYPSPATAATWIPVGGYRAPSPYTSYPPHPGIPEFPEHSFERNYSFYRPKNRISIHWDMENCRIPKGVRPEDVSINILAFLEHQTEIKWDVNSIAAYADFSKFSEKVRYGCQLTGVKLIDIPNVKEGAADRALIVALFEYAMFCPPPSSIMLVTGDVDFANALHVLRRWGHDIYLVIPSGVRVAPALTNASNYVWNWSDVVRGKVLHPTSSRLHKDV